MLGLLFSLFNFVYKRLGLELLLVVLFERHGAVVERFQVVAFNLLAPLLLQRLLSLAPLLVLGPEALEDEWHRNRRVALQGVDEVFGLVAIDALDRSEVDGLGGATKGVAEAELGQLVGVHVADIGEDVFEDADRAQVGFQDDVELEALVLYAEYELFVLVLLGADEGRVF